MPTADKPGVVIVTGAAQGLGRAYARRFASDGWRVVIADINGNKADGVRDEIVAAGGTAIAVTTDVSDEASCRAMAAAALGAYDRIDALVNNAAITDFERKPFWDIDVAEWDRILGVNTRGVWLAMKAVVPSMRVQRGGSVVNIASNTFLSGRAGLTHYIASKGAVIGITRAAARELGEDNIRVNCVLPGATPTEVPRFDLPPERVQVLLGGQAINRMEEPDDLVGVVAFLASEGARFMTGQSLVVDGGFSFL
jgi:3-oxoacyl-[acyl-carrier protein] reductase